MTKNFWGDENMGTGIYMVRGKETIADIIIFTVLFILCGWWGILWAALLHFLNHLGGGVMADVFGEYPTPPKSDIKCVAGHRNCKICQDGKINFYQDHRSLLQKIIGDC